MKAKTEQDNQTPSCANVAPLLTALFDGEADAQTAQSARAHLLSCERCARAWLDWNQHRTILCNENVPAPPPTLLWRVLLACRLANFAHGRKAKDSRRVEVEPRYTGLFPDAEMPTDLSARILAQTTRREVPAPIINRATKPSRWRLASWPTVAMPALAAWVILLAQGSQWIAIESSPVVDSVINSPEPSVEKTHSARPITPTRAVQTARSESGRSDIHRSGTPSKVARSEGAIASRSANSVRVQKADVERDVRSDTEEHHVAVRHMESHDVTPRTVESRVQQVRFEPHRVHPVQSKVEVRRESREEHSASGAQRDTAVPGVTLASLPVRPRSVVTFPDAMTSVVSVEKARTPVAQIAASSRPMLERPRVRVAALSDEVRAPRPRVARPVSAHFSQDARTALRSSLPAEPMRFASYESPDAAEEHVDEMRSVVDDFRSAFYNDESLDTLDSNAG